MHRTIVRKHDITNIAAFCLVAFAGSDAYAGPVTHFDLGREHGCAANDCGTAWCWGGEEFVFGGDKGVISTFSERQPFQVGAGDRHSCVMWRDEPFLQHRGIIDCWGRNDYGQIDVPEGTWRQLASGADHNCATLWNNEVMCWGRDDHGQVSGVPAGVTFATLSAGPTQSCGVSRNNDRILCWGKTAGGINEVPASVLPGAGKDPELFVKVSAGADHTCALTNYGRVYCWGSNDLQQTVPMFMGSPTGVEITLEDGAKIHWISGPRTYLDVSAGSAATCAVYVDHLGAVDNRHVGCWGSPFSYGGSLWAWMTNNSLPSTELPLGNFAPERAEVTANEACALDDDTGELRCWSIVYAEPMWSCDPADPACVVWELVPEVDPNACI